MNKTILPLLLTAICLFSFSGLRAQTYTVGNLTVVVPPPVMIHDSTYCQSTCDAVYNITKSSSFVGDSIMIVDTFSGALVYNNVNSTGVSPWTMTVPALNTTYNDQAVPVGGGIMTFMGSVVKVVSGSDTIHYITNSYPFLVTNPCTYGDAFGSIYVDNNGDCILNSGDVPLAAHDIVGTSNLSGPVPVMANVGMGWGAGAGHVMTFQQSWMIDYTISLQPYFNFIFPNASCSPVSYTFSTLPQYNVDFPVIATTLVDVECWAGSPSNARPNRPFFMQPYVSNLGYDTISGTLTFIKDSRVAYDATLSTNPAMTVSGDTLTWSYTNLTCIAGGAYWNNFMSQIHLTPNSTVNIGDTLCFHVYTGVPSTDVNPSNNDYTICLPVVNSYDPNIKEVSPQGTGVQGYIPSSTPDLTYTIHFQNTGTAPAIDVSVIDTLDADVDATTLKILGTSHNMLPEWLAPNVVKFNFSGIYLADSFSNEPASHGYVRFRVNLHSGLPVGTQVKNTGYIYFDTNPAVITNTALNTIALPSSINTPTIANVVKVYPNPASDNIFVENLQDGNLTILNMSGSVIIDKNITNDKTEIDISRLPGGIYILKTVSKDGISTRKFVKE